VIDLDDTETFDAAWFGQQLGGKSADWVLKHLDEIPHLKVGRTVRFTRRDLADYLTSVRVTPKYMATTGPSKGVSR